MSKSKNLFETGSRFFTIKKLYLSTGKNNTLQIKKIGEHVR